MPALAANETVYRVFKTALGTCAAARTAKGLCQFVLPLAGPEAARAAILQRRPNARRSLRSMQDLVASVRRYFNGWRTAFDTFPLDLSAATDFHRRVWTIVRRIPCGQVRTYHWVGMEIGRPHALRAIGNALAANPLPLIVPCHRVVKADGSLGGFSAPGGPDRKAKLLELERVRLVNFHGHVRVLA